MTEIDAIQAVKTNWGALIARFMLLGFLTLGSLAFVVLGVWLAQKHTLLVIMWVVLHSVSVVWVTTHLSVVDK